MHSFGHRANAVATFAVTILAAMCFAASFSDNFNTPTPTASVKVPAPPPSISSLRPRSPPAVSRPRFVNYGRELLDLPVKSGRLARRAADEFACCADAIPVV